MRMPSSFHRLIAFSCVFAAALAGCTVGGDDQLGSPYASASIDLATTIGVADGYTPVQLTITGEAGAELTLLAIGSGASFVAAGEQSPQEKTIFLRDDDGDGVGTATAGVVSAEARVVTVAFKVERVRSAREIDFVPVRLAVGTPQPVRFEPGHVVHDVCVAVNSAHGAVQAEPLSVEGVLSPTLAEVRTQPPDGLECPSEAVDAIGWQGYARFSWGTAVDFAEVTLSYVGPGEEALATDLMPLRGESFTGYEVIAEDPDQRDVWTSIALDVAYPDTATLTGGPAAGVTLEDIRFLPEPGLTFLGSSSGGAEEAPVTNGSGRTVLFFDTNGVEGVFALFVTPQGGATVYVTDIEVLVQY